MVPAFLCGMQAHINITLTQKESIMSRRPIDKITIARRRHLKNRRDTLVMGILNAEKSGELDRAAIIRQEVNKVNSLLNSLN